MDGYILTSRVRIVFTDDSESDKTGNFRVTLYNNIMLSVEDLANETITMIPIQNIFEMTISTT